jgi:hypothetical protein
MADRSTRTGGGNKVEFFSLTSSGGNVTFGTSLLVIDQIVSTTITGHETTKDLKFDWAHDKDNATIRGLLSTYLPPQGASTSTKYEDSSVNSVNSGNYTLLLGVLAYGGVDANSARLVKAAVVQLTGGDEKWEADKPTMIKFGGTAVQYEFPVVIAANKFSTSHLLAGALTTLAANGYGATLTSTKQA